MNKVEKEIRESVKIKVNILTLRDKILDQIHDLSIKEIIINNSKKLANIDNYLFWNRQKDSIPVTYEDIKEESCNLISLMMMKDMLEGEII